MVVVRGREFSRWRRGKGDGLAVCVCVLKVAAAQEVIVCRGCGSDGNLHEMHEVGGLAVGTGVGSRTHASHCSNQVE